MPAYILLVYLSISAAAALSYAIGGMSWFDAITHAMTSAATGGFANYDASFGYFNDKPWLLWLASLWMTMAALPFVLFVGMAKGDKWAVLRDPQVKAFLAVVLAVTLMLTLYQIQHHDRPWLDALKHTLFNVVSVITTCGYASEDYSLWGCMAVVLFFYLTFSGGCSGSTSGGCLWFRC